MKQWEDLALCNSCLGELVSMKSSIKCRRCKNETRIDQGWLNLTSGDLPKDAPIIEGQIGEPENPKTIEIVRDLFSTAITQSGIPKDDLRLLEIGAGKGRLAYGFLNVFPAKLYIATEPFPSLLGVLRNNLEKWQQQNQSTLVAAYDANCPLSLKPNVVNVAIGNSVLHHILHYEECIERLSKILDTPGALIFNEPSKDAWIFLLTVLNFLLLLVERDHTLSKSISKKSIEFLVRRQNNITQRMQKADDFEFLSSLDDKHLFSIAKMARIAKKHGLEMFAYKGNHDAIISVRRQLLQRMDQEDAVILDKIVTQVIPQFTQDSYQAQASTVFCFYKKA